MNRYELLRYERGLTITEAAKRANVSAKTIGALEDAGDDAKPSAPIALALASAYGITVPELLGITAEAA